MGFPKSRTRLSSPLLLSVFFVFLVCGACGSTPSNESRPSNWGEQKVRSAQAREEPQIKPAPPTGGKGKETGAFHNDEEKVWELWEREIAEEMVFQEQSIKEKREGSLLERYERRGKEGNDPLPWYLYGRLLGKLKRLEEAKKAFEKGLEIDPRFYPAREGLALYFLHKGEPDEAELNLRKALLINPRLFRGHFTLGGIYFNQQDFKKALVEFKKIPSEMEGEFHTYFHMGRCFQNLSQWDEAIQVLSKALEEHPEHQEIRYFLAMSFWGKGKKKEAFDTYLEAIQENPRDVYPHYQIGCLYLMEGEKEQALSHLRKALEYLPREGVPGISPEEVQRKILKAQEEEGAGEMGVQDVIREAASNPDPQVRKRNLILLSPMAPHPKITEAFARALLDEDPAVRTLAVWELGKREGPEAFSLLELVIQDKDPLVRGAVCKVMGELKERRAVPLLIRALRDNDSYVFLASHKALTRITGEVFFLGFLEDSPPEKRERLIRRWEEWWKEEEGRKVEDDESAP